MQLEGVDDRQDVEEAGQRGQPPVPHAHPLVLPPAPPDLQTCATKGGAVGLLLGSGPHSCVVWVSAFLSFHELSNFAVASTAVSRGKLLEAAVQMDPSRARAPLRLAVEKFHRPGFKNAVLVEENRMLVLPIIKALHQKAPGGTVLALLRAFPAGARSSDADVVASCLREYYSRGCSTLHIAAAVGSPEPVLRALARLEPALLSTPTASGALPLHVAASRRHAGAIRALLEEYPEGAQCVDGSPQYMLPLHVYLWQEDVAVGVDAELAAVKAFVAAYPEALSAACAHGLPLHLALRRRSPLPVVQWLLEQYPDAVATLTPRGDTALHVLCSSKPRVEVARALLAAQPAAAGERSRGDLPLHAALEAEPEPPLDLVRLLLESNPAALHSASADGRLALHIAVEAGMSVPIIQLLLNSFPWAALIQDTRGYLPYHCARMGSMHMGVRRRASFEVVDLLLSHYPEAELQPLVDAEADPRSAGAA